MALVTKSEYAFWKRLLSRFLATAATASESAFVAITSEILSQRFRCCSSQGLHAAKSTTLTYIILTGNASDFFSGEKAANAQYPSTTVRQIIHVLFLGGVTMPFEEVMRI